MPPGIMVCAGQDVVMVYERLHANNVEAQSDHYGVVASHFWD